MKEEMNGIDTCNDNLQCSSGGYLTQNTLMREGAIPVEAQ